MSVCKLLGSVVGFSYGFVELAVVAACACDLLRNVDMLLDHLKVLGILLFKPLSQVLIQLLYLRTVRLIFWRPGMDCVYKEINRFPNLARFIVSFCKVAFRLKEEVTEFRPVVFSGDADDVFVDVDSL